MTLRVLLGCLNHRSKQLSKQNGGPSCSESMFERQNLNLKQKQFEATHVLLMWKRNHATLGTLLTNQIFEIEQTKCFHSKDSKAKITRIHTI